MNKETQLKETEQKPILKVTKPETSKNFPPKSMEEINESFWGGIAKEDIQKEADELTTLQLKASLYDEIKEALKLNLEMIEAHKSDFLQWDSLEQEQLKNALRLAEINSKFFES